MLKRQHRLKKQADFLRVFKEGKRFNLNAIIITELPNTLGVPRFGVAVSKKINKKAVVRNRIRRSILAILESYQSLLAGEDVVVTVIGLPDESVTPYRYFQPIIRQWRAL